ARPAPIGVERPDLRVVPGGIDKHPGRIVVVEHVSARHIEPELVALDRAAESRVEVAVALDGVGLKEAARLQVVRQVAAGELLGRVAAKHGTAEGVTAISWKDV